MSQGGEAMDKLKLIPRLDPGFQPMSVVLRSFRRQVAQDKAKEKMAICVERQGGYRYRYDMDILGVNEQTLETNVAIIERLIKSILWVVGGYKIYLGGNPMVTEKLKAIFSKDGMRKFDVEFMSKVYREPFEVITTTIDKVPTEVKASIKIGGNLDGYRIGFDAGGSDRKVSAVVNGEAIYSEEVVWHPKLQTDPDYHYQGILDSFKRAASKMPRVDAIGVSSAGIYINNEVRVASLFINVPEDVFNAKARDVYIRAAKEIGEVPLEVANDGDVTALAGAMELKDTNVLGIAMGTSEAAGYINEEGNLMGWLSELAFVPVDFNKEAMVDEWSGDYGCGVKYFSQDAVIKLAPRAGIALDEKLSPAEKLKVVQGLMKEGDERAKAIYESIGIYLGYALAYYSEFYQIKHLLLLGRVTSGDGGLIIVEKAKEVLVSEFPEYQNILIHMPDENSRRVGQSIAAASLPKA